MPETKRHLHYTLMDVRYLGDLKISFKRNSKGPWVSVESLSGQPLPEFTDAPVSPPTHKFVASVAAVG